MLDNLPSRWKVLGDIRILSKKDRRGFPYTVDGNTMHSGVDARGMTAFVQGVCWETALLMRLGRRRVSQDFLSCLGHASMI